jgi:hypothetical protein
MAKKKRDRSATQAEQPNTGEHPKAEKPEKGSKGHRTTVSHEALVTGTALTATLKGQTFSASVVLGPDGKPEVEFDDARYPSLSAAGKAAVGYPVNGWRFWRAVQTGEQ